MLGAVLIVGVTASPALADISGSHDGGLRTYSWPKHDCGSTPTQVDLYTHYWVSILNGVSVVDGRFHYHSGSCNLAAGIIDIHYMKLWDYYSGSIHQVASTGEHILNPPLDNYNSTWSTPDPHCHSNFNDSYWVEVSYQIIWNNYDETANRDDNSYTYSPGCAV